MRRCTTLLTLLLGIALPAAAADAAPQPPLAAECASNPRCIGLGDPVADDAVIVRWRISATTTQTVRVRSLQAHGGGTVTTATTDPVEVAAGGVHEFDARLPIAVGGTPALVDAVGSPQFEAVTEPDVDGDGYGDLTQDACPAEAGDHTAPCDGRTTIGSALTLASDPRDLDASGAPLQATQTAPDGKSPIDGVLTLWRFRADPLLGATVLQVLRPTTTPGTFTVVAESPPQTVADGGVKEVAAQIPVRAGDVLAFRSTSTAGPARPGPVAAVAGSTVATRLPPAALGQTWARDPAANGGPAHFRMLVQADIEPDADGDGKGDITRSDLAVTGAGPERVGPWAPYAHVYTVRNLGPDWAVGVHVVDGNGRDAWPAPGSAVGMTCTGCPAALTFALAPGGSLQVIAANATPAPGYEVQTVVTRLGAGSDSIDPVADNNRASLTTARDALGRPAAPPPGVARPCVNVIRGTRDDDVLRGTAFGDRLVGNDGDDLLKGNGADDCLEGGAGNDVLDGGDGNDRLASGAGKDRLTGGKGNDKLTGGRGNDRLSGGAGQDVLAPGSGKDSVDAGPGQDTINSVDGVREKIDCGSGTDTIRADRVDRLKGCEKVTRR